MPKPPRYWFRLILAFVDRFKLVFIIGALFGIVIFALFEILIPNLPNSTTKIGIAGKYTPDNLPNSITKEISIGLTTLDKSGKATSGIATDWEASDSGKTWTFHINKNLKWQDGTNVTTADINYNFTDASVERPDKYTIIFKLKTAFSPFPVTLSKPLFKKGLLGVGDYKVSGLTLTGTYIETLTLQNKEKDQIVYKFYPTEERLKLAYELGEVQKITDLIDNRPFDSWNTAKIDKNTNLQRYVGIFFNTADQLTADKEFRQALDYGIDKNQFGQQRALGPISPNSWGFNPSLKPYEFDIAHAKELIKDSKIDPEAKKNLKIKLTTIPDLLPEAEMIAKNWKELGIETDLQVTSYMPDDYQAFLAIYDIPNDPDQYATWHSSQTQTNLTRYKNTRIDKLLEDGRLETDQNKRKAIYFDFQKFLVEDIPAAFLYYPTYYNVSRK